MLGSMAGTESLNDAFVLVAGTLSMVLMVLLLIGFAYIFQRKLLKKQLFIREVEKMLKKEELNSAYALIEGQEKERQRIAADLHDNLGSLFALIKLNARQINAAELSDKSNKGYQQMITLIDKALEENRRISHNLDALSLNHFGFEVAVNQLFDILNQTGKLQASRSLYLEKPLDNQLSLHLYRIIQELVSNTLKHAMASSIHLEVNSFENELINVIYTDNGVGFGNLQIKQGKGLESIYKRVELWSGTVDIVTAPGKGVEVIIDIPLKKTPHE